VKIEEEKRNSRSIGPRRIANIECYINVLK
jgi:hypothetical protein